MPGIPTDRAKIRTTFMANVTESLQLGLEVNPIGPDVGPLATWRAIDEGESNPALIFSTSSDRIGTPGGRQFIATVSKNIEDLVDLPFSPYVGVSYGTYRDEFVPQAGAVIRYGGGFSSTHLWDGGAVHHVLNYDIDEVHSVGLILVDYHHVGFSYSIGFHF